MKVIAILLLLVSCSETDVKKTVAIYSDAGATPSSTNFMVASDDPGHMVLAIQGSPLMTIQPDGTVYGPDGGALTDVEIAARLRAWSKEMLRR